MMPRLLPFVFVCTALAGCMVHTHHRADVAAPAPKTTAHASAGVDAHAESAHVECHGADVVTLEGKTIETPGTAIEAHGACTVTLVRCHIKAGGVAIESHGKSRVIVKDSNVEGGTAAAELHGASRIELTSSTLKGRVDTHGLSELVDLGGNTRN